MRGFGAIDREQANMRIVKVAHLSMALLCLGAATDSAPRGAMLPDRLLTCSIGHVINFDASKDQTAADLRFDGFHTFSLFLPAHPALVGRPPDASEPAPPVNPRTRIVSDPDHISGQPDNRFGRIVDLWPDRIELSAQINGALLNTIVINPIDPAGGTANLFMMRATELTHFDPEHIYQGNCRITTGMKVLAPSGKL